MQEILFSCRVWELRVLCVHLALTAPPPWVHCKEPGLVMASRGVAKVQPWEHMVVRKCTVCCSSADTGLGGGRSGEDLGMLPNLRGLLLRVL